jgi:hypothetical protein
VRFPKLILCTVMTVVVGAAALPVGAAAAEVLNGSGSTLVAPLWRNGHWRFRRSTASR